MGTFSKPENIQHWTGHGILATTHSKHAYTIILWDSVL